MTAEILSAEEIRREIAGHLVAIAGTVPAGTSVKEIFRRVETRLAHPEINGRMVKALWYREIKNIPAHIADHVRGQVDAKPEAAFVVDSDGRISSGPQPGWSARSMPIRARVESSRITVEVSPSRATRQGMATLRHWLLSLLLEDRPFRVVDLDRSTVSDLSGPLAAIDRIEGFLHESASCTAVLTDRTAMLADEFGVRPLDAGLLDSLGIHAEADYDVPAFLARNMGFVIILPDGPQLHVLARASGHSTRPVENAAAYLAMRREPVRLAVWWCQSWLRENEAEGHIAARRLRQFCGLGRPVTPPAAYEGQRLRLDEVPECELVPFRPLLGLIGARFDSGTFGNLLGLGLGDRLAVADVSGEATRLLYFPYGPDYYDRSWALNAIGKPIGDQPDRAYGIAVEKRYLRAARDDAVHFERVRATIRESAGRLAGDCRRSSYARLIVPFSDGRQRLAVAYTAFIRQPGTVD